jgi:hypothetical protein
LSKFKLCADAIGSSNQNGVCVSGSFQIKDSAKTTNPGISTGAMCPFRIISYRFDEGITSIDIYTCIFIS